MPQRREIKKIAKSRPADHDLPLSTWSLSKLAEFLLAEGVVDDISHEGLRVLLREEGVTFQRIKTWKASKDPRYAAKKARIEHLYAIADGEVALGAGEPAVVLCCDNFSPHLTTAKDARVGAWAKANNVELAYTPANSSWLNRIPVHRPALLHPRWHRPPQPPGAGQHDPPVHHLA